MHKAAIHNTNNHQVDNLVSTYNKDFFKPSAEDMTKDNEFIYSVVYSKKIAKYNNQHNNSSGILISRLRKHNIVDNSEIFKSDDIDTKQYIKINTYKNIDCYSNKNLNNDVETQESINFYSIYSLNLSSNGLDNLLYIIKNLYTSNYNYLYHKDIAESIDNKTEGSNLLYIYALLKYLKENITTSKPINEIPLSTKNMKILFTFLNGETDSKSFIDFTTNISPNDRNRYNNKIRYLSCYEEVENYVNCNLINIIDFEKHTKNNTSNYYPSYYNIRCPVYRSICHNIIFTTKPIKQNNIKELAYLSASAYQYQTNIFNMRNFNIDNEFLIYHNNNINYDYYLDDNQFLNFIKFINKRNNEINKLLKFKPIINNFDEMILCSIEIYIDYDKYYNFTHNKLKIDAGIFKLLFPYKNIKKHHLYDTEFSNTSMYDNFNKQASNQNLNEEYFEKDRVNEKYNNTLSNLTLEPFDYQKKNIIWMDNLENKIFNNKSRINMLKDSEYNLFLMNKKWYTLKKNHTTDSLSYSLNDYELFNKNNKYSLSLQGGILADEVGLGKTFSTISHLMNQLNNDRSMKNNEDHTSYNFECNNLIIVPARLVTQWKLEIKKYVKPDTYKKLNIKVCSVVKDITKHKYEDFVKSDIVIVSLNLLLNENYTKYLIGETTAKTATTATTATSTTTKSKETNNKKEKEKEEKKIDLFKMKWNRVIIDEAHEFLCSPLNIKSNYFDIFTEDIKLEKEIINNDLYKRKNYPIKLFDFVKKLYKMKINYKWLLSATPFVHPILNYNSYLNFLSSSSELENFIYNRENDTFDIFCKKRIRRNTKKSIASEIDIPIISEEVKFIKQTPTERNIYLDYERQNKLDKLYMLCTHILVSDNDNKVFGTDKIISMSDINTVMTKKYKSELETSSKELEKINAKFEYCKNRLSLFEEVHTYINEKYNFDDDTSSYYLNPNIKNIITEVLSRSRMDKDGTLKIYNYYLDHNINIFINELFNYMLIFKNLDDSQQYFAEMINYCNEYTSSGFEYVNSYIKITDESSKVNIKYYILKQIISKVIISAKKNNYKIYEKKIKELENTVLRCTNQIKLFEKTSNFVSESIKDPCAICFCDFEETFCMLKCRHILCEYCLSQIFKSNTANCPFCRTPNVKTDIRKVKIETEEEIKQREEEERKKKEAEKKLAEDKKNASKEEFDLISNIEKYGSKLANLIQYLNNLFENPENRVIIFSQYDKMLKMVGDVLSQFSIKHIYMKGNVRVLNKNIERFKTDNSYRVIMLSSETSASGNNLTEANNIIFVDVLNADKQKTMDIEAQAIGRSVRLGQKKPVKITRFIMKNTIEETTYNENKYSITENC